MASREEFLKAKEEFEQYWKPVAGLFQEATSRDAIQEACRSAGATTGCKYCFGLGYLSEPLKEEEDVLNFHGWLYDESHSMITVWYTHGNHDG